MVNSSDQDILGDISALKEMAGAGALIRPAIRHFESGNLDEAEALAARILKQMPFNTAAVNLLGSIALNRNQFELARELISRAVRMSPADPSFRMNLCLVMEKQGNLQEALGAYQELLAAFPAHAETHYNHALLLLLTGNFAAGWQEYEWRKRMSAMQPFYRDCDGAQWGGEPLQGRTLLLCAEQGLGDTIQFIRYVGPLAGMGARVIVRCQERLRSLLSAMPGIDALVTQDERLPAFDVRADLMSVPWLMRTTLETIPARVPYLFPPEPAWPAGVDFGVDTRKKNIGIVWAGNPRHRNDINRSVGLARFGALMDVPGTRWLSLQVGERAGECGITPGFEGVANLAPLLRDFSCTAAVIRRLDLVITVDTSVAHLAGALGVPVWVLLPYHPDWRWLTEREDSPWYPSMRLFRQAAPGDWTGVFQRVRRALEDTCS